MGIREPKSTAEVQRRNKEHSAQRLAEVLCLNFTASSRLVTLTYREDARPRSRALAVIQGADWIRGVRACCGNEIKYITALEWP